MARVWLCLPMPEGCDKGEGLDRLVQVPENIGIRTHVGAHEM